jgi:hypothetical protein
MLKHHLISLSICSVLDEEKVFSILVSKEEKEEEEKKSVQLFTSSFNQPRGLKHSNFSLVIAMLEGSWITMILLLQKVKRRTQNAT